MSEQPAATRRVTPGAYLVLPADAPRATWLEARRRGIGSSDVANILGVGGKTAGHVFWDKLGRLSLDEDEGEAALWGQLDEDTTAREWARRNRSAMRKVGLVASVDEPWQMTTLDRRVTVCPLDHSGIERCAVEIKHTGAWRAGRWRRQVPDDVLAQLLWQLIVTRYQHIHYAVRIGGNDYRQGTVRASEHTELIEDIRTSVSAFWREHVLAKRPPVLAGDEEPDDLLDLDARLYPVRDGNTWAELSEADLDLVAEYDEAAGAAGAAKDRQDAAKAALVLRLAGKQHAALNGEWVFSFADNSPKTGNSYTRTKLDKNRLWEVHPTVYADVTEEVPQHKLQINGKYRTKSQEGT